MSWNPISTAPENVLVMTKIDDEKGVRNEQTLHRNGRMWYGGSMYVYYQPTHWRELTTVEKLKLKNEAEAKAIRELERANNLLGIG
jgi:hypothetical protein